MAVVPFIAPQGRHGVPSRSHGGRRFLTRVGEHTLSVLGGIRAVTKREWDAVAGLASPFLRYDYLNALEVSNSVGASEGW